MNYKENTFYKVTEYAIKYLQEKNTEDPVVAWNTAVEKLIDKPEFQRKHCPKATFLELCQLKLVSLAKDGNYSKSRCQESYAKKAYELLMHDNSLSNGKNASSELWKKVLKELNTGKKTHDRQMDVVLALWNNNVLI